MVHLADQCASSPGQTLGEMELPQRVAAVQRRARDFTDNAVELTSAARGGYPQAPKVIVEVDLTVLQPHRVVHPPWNVDEPVAERLEKVQPSLKGPAKFIETEHDVALRRVE